MITIINLLMKDMAYFVYLQFEFMLWNFQETA